MPAGGQAASDGASFRFAGLTLDLRQGRLFDAKGDVPLRAKPYALLGYMVRNAGRVLSKQELLDAVWPDVTVGEDSLAQCIHAVRDALGAGGAGLVRTVPRRGYVFDLPVERETAGIVARPSGAGGTAMPSSKPGSIAVLPFGMDPMVPGADRLWFDGVVNDVISQLARLRSYDVIARGSVFALRDQVGDPRKAGLALGVDYVLAGWVEPQGDRFRLRIDLVRTETGTIVTTEEVEVRRAGFLDLVGELVDRITATVLTGVTAAERNRARLVPEEQLTAWQAYHRGLEAYAIYSEPTLLQARALLLRATELDPGFVRAFAALSDCHAIIARTIFCKDKAAEATAALRMAEVAMRLDEASPAAQFAYAHARWSNGSPEVALIHAEQSVALSPSFADGHAEIGFYSAMYADPDRAFACLARAEVLNPINPFIDSVHIDRAVAHLQSNNLDEAALWATKAVSRRESYPQMQITGALVLAAAGRLESAQAIVGKLREDRAVFDPRKIFKPPFSVAGPARERLLRAVAVLGF